MQSNRLPANLWLLQIDDDLAKHITPVTVLDSFYGGTENFHDEGLFSVSIFGRVGSDERMTRMSYIDAKLTVLQPTYFKDLIALKQLYGKILSGTAYAKWDDKEKDFVNADVLTGDTGYAFFMSRFNELEFKKNDSQQRALRVDFLNKNRDKALNRRIAVMPAGLRDLQIDADGQTTESDINKLYRKVIGIANTISEYADPDDAMLDSTRYNLQLAFNAIYEYIILLLGGKSGFVQKGWGSRRVFKGTRNVITAMNTLPPVLGSKAHPGANNTVIGLYQCAKGVEPKTKFWLKSFILDETFEGRDGYANLIDPKTLTPTRAIIDPDDFDRYNTPEGLGKVINMIRTPWMRSMPVKVGKYFLALIYVDDVGYRVFKDINELPKTFNRKNVSPLNYAQLIYLAGLPYWNDIPTTNTRYPITGQGSIYLSKVYLKTTSEAKRLKHYNEMWELEEDLEAYEFPDPKKPWFDAMSPHPSRLALLGGDNFCPLIW